MVQTFSAIGGIELLVMGLIGLLVLAVPVAVLVVLWSRRRRRATPED